MNLAIYGDSWADCSSYTSTDLRGWPELLKPHFGHVDNFAVAASSLYFSYNQFINSHHNYSKIIFVATSVGRWTRTIKVDGKEKFVHSYGACEFLLKHSPISRSLSLETKQNLEHLKNYYLHVQDMGYEEAMHILMLDKIKQLRPDAIMVSITKNHLPGPCMVDFLDLFVDSCWPNRPDLKSTGENKYRWSEKEMVCHLTQEINQLVCDAMMHSIAQGKWQYQLPTFVKHTHPGEYYVSLE